MSVRIGGVDYDELISMRQLVRDFQIMADRMVAMQREIDTLREAYQREVDLVRTDLAAVDGRVDEVEKAVNAVEADCGNRLDEFENALEDVRDDVDELSHD